MRYTLRRAPGVGQGQKFYWRETKTFLSKKTAVEEQIRDRRQRLLIECEVNDLILVKSEIDAA
jgi:hypothetical protein